MRAQAVPLELALPGLDALENAAFLGSVNAKKYRQQSLAQSHYQLYPAFVDRAVIGIPLPKEHNPLGYRHCTSSDVVMETWFSVVY